MGSAPRVQLGKRKRRLHGFSGKGARGGSILKHRPRQGLCQSARSVRPQTRAIDRKSVAAGKQTENRFRGGSL
jgi:hypothetical protein